MRYLRKAYLIEPDIAIRDALTTLLESFDVPVVAYPDGDSFLDVEGSKAAGCVVVEAELPGLNGMRLLKALRERGNHIPVVLLVERQDPTFAQRARIAGASGAIVKPLINDELIMILQHVCAQYWPGLAVAGRHDYSLTNGRQISIRPIQPSDRALEQSFVKHLSPASRLFRFLGGVNELSDSMLDQFTRIHYPENIALIALATAEQREDEIGVARYVLTSGRTAEFAVVVADAWQGQGVATLLLRQLFECARLAQLENIVGIVRRDNRGMLRLARQFGFSVQVDVDDSALVQVKLRLEESSNHKRQMKTVESC